MRLKRKTLRKENLSGKRTNTETVLVSGTICSNMSNSSSNLKMPSLMACIRRKRFDKSFLVWFFLAMYDDMCLEPYCPIHR